nr:uncharacterized protein LOC128689233 [Cherax quadricarinatus]
MYYGHWSPWRYVSTSSHSLEFLREILTMFDAEDDVSFEDPLFLQEVVRFTDSSSASHSESTPCFQDNYSDGIKSNFPLRNASGNSCGVKNNVSENRVDSNDKQKEKTTLKFISQKCGYMEKIAADNSFEFDDLFDDDIEHKVNKKSCVTSTPPDSEFTQSLISNTCKQVEINKNKSNSATNGDVVRGSNFRSRILQTLKENNLVGSLSCKPFSSQSRSGPPAPCTYQKAHKKDLSSDSDIHYSSVKLTFRCHRLCSDSAPYAVPKGHGRSQSKTLATDSDSDREGEYAGMEEEEPFDFDASESGIGILPECPITNEFRELDFFQLYIDEPTMNLIVTQMNNYNYYIMDNTEVAESSWLRRWKLWMKLRRNRKHKPRFSGDSADGAVQAFHANDITALTWHDKWDVTLLSIIHSNEMYCALFSITFQEIVCSQNFVDDFSRGPWLQMMNDLELDQTDPVSPLQVFNIKWLLRRASLRGKAGVRKIPFLAVIVRNLDVTHSDATTVLRDPTGEMNGTIASSVIDEYGPSLQPGSVLLLRGVTVLSPVGLRTAAGLREHTRRHYLNITLNTVLSIYTADESGHVITTSVGNFDKRELCKQAAAPETAGGPRAIIEEEEEEEHGDFSAQNHSLFSKITDSHSQFGQSTNLPRIPNYRSPRAASNNILHCNPGQPQKCPQVNNKQLTSPLISNKPTIDATRFNGTIMGPGTPTAVQHLQPQFHQSLIKSVVSLTSKSSSGFSSSMLQNKNIKKIPNFKKLADHAEEKEIKDLLDGVDADSLFGDF